jgi:hypothetical protein
MASKQDANRHPSLFSAVLNIIDEFLTFRVGSSFAFVPNPLHLEELLHSFRPHQSPLLSESLDWISGISFICFSRGSWGASQLPIPWRTRMGHRHTCSKDDPTNGRDLLGQLREEVEPDPANKKALNVRDKYRKAYAAFKKTPKGAAAAKRLSVG